MGPALEDPDMPDPSPETPSQPEARSDPADAPPARVVAGRYRLVRQIGSGGMGRVFEAVDLQLERSVAVKLLAAEEDEEHRELFRRESRLLARLKHPNIVAVHEAGQDDGRGYIAMDLVEGISMARVLGEAHHRHTEGTGSARVVPRDARLLGDLIGPDPPTGRPDLIGERSWYRAAASIAAELVGTLEAAHGQGVIHRDLKPGNVMLLPGGSPVVLDFGIAGRLDAATGALTGGLYGTVAYLAPEQVKSERIGADPRTDVYQLGLLLYELLTLRRAIRGSSMAAVLHRITRGQFERPRRVNPAIPPDLEAICLMAVELRPEDRYATAREMREDLERYLRGDEVPIAARAGRVRRWVRGAGSRLRNPAVSGAGAALLTALVVLAVFQMKSSPLPISIEGARAYADGVDRVLKAGGRVSVGEELGVAIRNEDPAWIYALSVYGGDDRDSRRVSPMIPQPRPMPEEVGRDGRWDLHLEPGEHEVACTRIDEGSLEVELEGLIVFACPQPEEWLEAGLGELHALGGAVPFEEAMERLHRHAGTLTRGGMLTGSEEEARLSLAVRELTLEQIAGEERWPLEEIGRLDFFARVTGR